MCLRYFVRYLLVFFAVFLAPQMSSLEASGWGQTGKTFEREGSTWNEVFFNKSGLNFRASIPNYAGAVLQKGFVSLGGNIEKDVEYVIVTPFNTSYKSPKTVKIFIKMVRKAYPSHIIKKINAKKLGAKYAVDMIPKNQENRIFLRFLSTKNRLINMGTNDNNEKRRLYFFNSLRIRSKK